MVGVDKAGLPVVRKQLRRKQVLAYFTNLPACLVAMEACGGSHYWAREIAKLGHEAKLISPQFVKPYVKGNKNDYSDAEGICEAAGRATRRFVTVKTLVPRQHTTEDRPVLLGISKRGDKSLRTLLIHGAPSAIRWMEGKADSHSRWLQAVVARCVKNKAAVALANKNARIIWALLSRGECYQPTG